MFPFPEDTFLCAVKDRAAYTEAVRRGADIAKEMQVAILMLARDVGRRLDNTIQYVEATGDLFKQYAVQIVENDSIDDTRRRLLDWGQANPRVRHKAYKLQRKKWGMTRHASRGSAMAEYRNRCKELAEVFIKTADAVLVVDSDLYGWSLDGICHTFSKWGSWDGVLSNGIRKTSSGKWRMVDAWAFREKTWHAKDYDEVKKMVPKRGEEWWRVNSAFGGVGIYTAEAYSAARYIGGDCEHVKFHRSMMLKGHNRIYLNPSQIVVYSM
jgi:hypothetical protein